MAKSADDSKTNRLTDMVVKEVSLVDRAANKRVFLITKRDESSMATKLVSDGRGGFSTVEVTKTEGAPPAATAPSAALTVVTEDAETEVEKAETVQMIGALADRILTIGKAYREKGEALPETFEAEIAGMVGTIRKRRMGKARMDKFEAGIASLQDLLKELKGETETTKAAPPAAPAAAAPVAAPAASAPSAADTELAKRCAEQEVELKKLRGMPIPPNSGPTEEGSAGGGSGEFAWPTDMASGKRTEANKKAGLTF